MLDPNVISPEILDFIMGIVTGFLTKKGEDILEKSIDRILGFLRKELGKDEIEKIKGLTAPDARKRLEKLVKDKNVVREVHTFYVIYRYLEKFTAGSMFLRMMDFRRGEGLPLEKMYVKLQIVEEKKKEVINTSRYYEEECYYRINRRKRNEDFTKRIDPDEIMNMEKGLVCILGLPGAGKTTLCKYFCWKTLKGKYTKKGLPIYVELKGIEKREDPVTYALYSELKEHFTKEEIEEAITMIKHNAELFSPIFIFDGLDEIEKDRSFVSESVRNIANSSLCIVTSRRSGFIYMLHDKTYEILPWEWEGKKRFVENYFRFIKEEEKINSFLQVLEERGYNSLSKNPMLLSMLCALASDEEDVGNIPSRKSGLYKKIVMKMEGWHESRDGEGLSQEEKRNLEDLALKLFRERRPRILFEEGISEEVLRKAVAIGIIFKWDESSYSFLHLTLQEYFAARSLKALGTENWWKIIREKKDDIVWSEIIQLLAAILNEEEQYEELELLFSVILEFPDILRLNYALAGHCLGEIDVDEYEGSDEILKKVISEFETTACKHFFQDVLVHLGDKAVDPLIGLLEGTDNVDLMMRISKALGEIGDSKAVDPLIVLLEGTDNVDLMLYAARALIEIGKEAVDPLIDLLERTDNVDLMLYAARALIEIGKEAVDPLIALFEGTDNISLKMEISEALGNSKEPRAIDSLMDMLETADTDNLRRKVSKALDMIGEEAVDPLIALVERTDSDSLKMRISKVLGDIGDPRAVGPLITLLKRTDNDKLKEYITSALGGIGENALDPLIYLLEKTDDSCLKMNIPLALGEIGDSKAVDPLIILLKRTDKPFPKICISWALGEIGDPKALDPLIADLEKTDDYDLRYHISVALGKIGGKSVDPLSALMEKTDNNDLKAIISGTLGNIGDPRAVDPLIALMEKTDDNYSKMTISWALAKIGDPRTADFLVAALEQTNDVNLIKDISWTLAKIRDPKTVDPLIVALENANNNLSRLNILLALGKIGCEAVEPLITLLERTNSIDLKSYIVDTLGYIGNPKAVDPLIDILVNRNDQVEDPGSIDSLESYWKIVSYFDLRWRVSLALVRIGDEAADKLTSLLMKADNTNLKFEISRILIRINPTYLYVILSAEKTLDMILNDLCYFATEYGMRFFEDRIALPGGEILFIKTEDERKRAIKKINKIILETK